MKVSPPQSELLHTLFEAAKARPAQERPAFLREACPLDAGLQEYVLRLIDADETDPDFLQTPILEQILSWPVLEAGDLIDGRYRIIRLVGRGGMGEVYEAEDTELGERVALKTVRRDLFGHRELVARLRSEVELAHAIAHPNVCKIHHLGIDSRPDVDLVFLIMAFLDGETLAERLARNGPLSKDASREILEQVAAGLEAAHDEGVVHLDLKCGNIMLVPRRDGTTRAVITDLGIACRVEEEYRRGPGTTAYMSPERLREPAVSPSADIYSLGVIMHEMVTGTPAIPGRIRTGAGARWDRAVRRCLDPVPQNRFAYAREVVEALRVPAWRLPAAACAALLIPAALLGPTIVHRLDRWLTTTIGPAQVMAILPFEGDGADGLIDNLSDQLQKNRVVRDKWLVFTPGEMKQMGVRTAAQAKALVGATHVLSGKMSRDSDGVTLTAYLVDTKTSRPAGSFQKTCPPDNAACLHGSMIQAAVGLLIPQSSAVAPPPVKPAAFQYYLQGLHYLRRDSNSHDLAISFFQQALHYDPESVQTRVLLADALTLRFRATGDRKALEEARKILGAVLQTHPDLPDLHASLGNLYRIDGEYDAAIRELQAAIQADPSNHIFHLRLGRAYDASWQDAEAKAEFEQVLQLQPRYWAGYLDYAIFRHRRGQFQQAAALLEQMLEWAPDHAQGLATLGGVYVDMGRDADAERVSKRSCELQPDPACFFNYGLALQRQGQARPAIAAYDKALSFGSPDAMLLLGKADAHAFLGERTQAAVHFRQCASQAEENLKINMRDSGERAILAYCLAQTGDRRRAEFELEQALKSSPQDKNVKKYAVLTYESTGQRDKSIEILRGISAEILNELERAWGTEQLRRDPRYPEIAREVRSR